MRKSIFWVITVLMLISPCLALNIGLSPGVISFDNMVKGGYAEASALISTSSTEALRGHFEVEGEIAEWITIEPDPEEFTVSVDNPYGFRIVVQPSADAKNGNYTGILRIQTDSLATVERGAGSSVIAAVAMKINIEITGEETINCNAGALSISSTEIDEPFTVGASVLNTGNVRLRPTFLIEIWDQSQQSIVLTKTFLGTEILPTTQKRIVQNVEQDLDIGQYFADITLKECGITETHTFDVLEKGGIADRGQFVGIRTNKYAYIGQPNPIIPVFRNTGKRTVVAKFQGQIQFLDENKLVDTLESDELSIEPGQTQEFTLYFTPEKRGKYQVTGRILYNKKITFEEKSAVIEVVPSKQKNEIVNIVFLFILYLIVGLVILILLAKIRKERKKRR